MTEDITDRCVITYGDLYMLLFWATVILAAAVVIANVDVYELADKIIAYFDKTAMQYMHMRGETFKQEEHKKE